MQRLTKQNDTQNRTVQLLTKNIENNETKSITEALCPKYRKFTHFPSQQNDNQNQNKDSNNHAQEKNEKNSVLQKRSQSLMSKRIIMIPPQLSKPKNDQTPSNKLTQAQSPMLKQRKQQQSILLTQPSTLRPFSEQKARQQITATFTELNTMISNISQHFQKRMKTHQDELLKIMMIEMQKLNDQCEKTIRKYNQLIRQKTINSGNEEILLQLGFYRKHSANLQSENQMLKKEIQYLKRLNNEYELRLRTDQETLRHVTRKLMHYKKRNKQPESANTHNMSLIERSLGKSLDASIIANSNSQITNNRIKTQQKLQHYSSTNTNLGVVEEFSTVTIKEKMSKNDHSLPAIMTKKTQHDSQQSKNQRQKLKKNMDSFSVNKIQGQSEGYKNKSRMSVAFPIRGKNSSPERKITLIKNRVKLSSFEQEQFENLKKSIQLAMLQKNKSMSQYNRLQ